MMFAAIKECQIPGHVEFAIDHTGIDERRIGESQVCTLIARVLSKRRTNYMQKVVSGVRRGRNGKLGSLGRRRCAHHGHDGRCPPPAREHRKGQGERQGARGAAARRRRGRREGGRGGVVGGQPQRRRHRASQLPPQSSLTRVRPVSVLPVLLLLSAHFTCSGEW
jgi:hypothetical protein